MNQWVDGIGLVFTDSSKPREEQQASMDYFIETAPMYEDLDFLGGWNESKSQIYRQYLNFTEQAPSTVLQRLLDEKKITEEEYRKAMETGKVDIYKFPEIRQSIQDGFQLPFFKNPTRELRIDQPPKPEPVQLDMKKQEVHKQRWLEEQMKGWGQYVGWYDSIALDKYYNTIEKSKGTLTKEEQADKDANKAMLNEIDSDMTTVYENIWMKKGGQSDISDVQKKYGFEPEELDTLQSLKAAYNFATENPTYMLGNLAGMLAKDPQYLAISYLRIPSLVGRSTQAAQNLGRAALNIKPKYYKAWEKMSYGQRVGYSTLGRGVEGAVYGGVYEGMRDLTFNGHINAQNVKTGAAMGALFGTAFGGIGVRMGKDVGRNWMLNKSGSVKALEQFQKMRLGMGDLKFKKFDGADGQKIDALGWDGKWSGSVAKTIKERKTAAEIKAIDDAIIQNERANPIYKANLEQPTRGGTVELALPEGLNHIDRGTLWRNQAIERVNERLNAGKKESDLIPLDEIAKSVDDAISKRADDLMIEIGKDGEVKYSKQEREGIAAKQEAKFQESKLDDGTSAYKEWQNQTGNKSVYDKKWGSQREINKRDRLRQEGESVREPSSFDTILPNVISEAKRRVDIPNAAKFKAAIIGGLLGAVYLNDDGTDYGTGAFLGMALGFLARTRLPLLNKNKAMLKKRVYQAADDAEAVTMEMNHQIRALTDRLGLILKGKNPKLTSSKFIDFLENYTPIKKGQKGYAERLKIITERKALVKKYPEIGEAMTVYRSTMSLFKEMATEAGVLLDEQMILDYVTHIVKKQLRSKPEDIIAMKNVMKKALDKNSPFDNMRGHQATIAQLKKAGYEIEDDIFSILDAYSRSITKAITGRMIIKNIKDAQIQHGKHRVGLVINQGESIAKIAVKELDYVRMNHPALEGMLVHPNVAQGIDQFFAVSKGGLGLGDKILLVNNTIKRLNIAASLFHAQALIMSGIYSGAYTHLLNPNGKGIAKMKKIRQMMKAQWSPDTPMTDASGKPVYQRGSNGVLIKDANGKPIQLMGDYLHKDLMNELALSKMSIGQARTNEALLPGYRGFKKVLEKHPSLKPFGKVQDLVDKATWDMLHDYSKIFTYMLMKENMMSAKPKGIGRIKFIMEGDGWTGMGEKDARTVAAAFTDDAFGGQNMTRLANEWMEIAIKNADNPAGPIAQLAAAALTPNKVKWANLFLFSPDWTLSNLRIAFRGVGMSTKGLEKVFKGQKLTPKEAAEINAYVGYTVRGMIATSFFAFGIHKMLSTNDNEFDLLDFWKTGRLALGGGEEMVISKQIAEPMHWIMNPFHTALSKGSVMPKTIMEVVMGKEYLSLKTGQPTGPNLDRDDPTDLAFWMLNKASPIASSPLSSFGRQFVDDDYPYSISLQKALRNAAFGFVGLPIFPRKERVDVSK